MPAFSHEELEVKRHFLAIAREHLSKSNVAKDEDESLAYELSAALLYMNVADYLAEYLLANITDYAETAVGEYYHGVITIRKTTIKDMNIGNCIKGLKKFEFPRREDILALLNSINESRNKVAHKILKVKAAQLNEIDEAVRTLKDKTEELILIVDQIQLGMPPKNLYDTLSKQGPNK